MDIRTGNGFDVHVFAEGRDMILGGVKIPFDRGLYGHSDADVLLHAVMDALLGAAGLGDIGKHFPAFHIVSINNIIFIFKILIVAVIKKY